jgi:hypothetical protein
MGLYGLIWETVKLAVQIVEFFLSLLNMLVIFLIESIKKHNATKAAKLREMERNREMALREAERAQKYNLVDLERNLPIGGNSPPTTQPVPPAAYVEPPPQVPQKARVNGTPRAYEPPKLLNV